MYEVTWISRGGEVFGVCSPNYRALFRLYSMMLYCGFTARIWDRSIKNAPVLVF